MPGPNFRIMIKGIVVLASGVLIAAAALSRDADRATSHAAAATGAGIAPMELMIASRTFEQADEGAVWSAEPNPENFDRADLEMWWKRHERKRAAH